MATLEDVLKNFDRRLTSIERSLEQMGRSDLANSIESHSLPITESETTPYATAPVAKGQKESNPSSFPPPRFKASAPSRDSSVDSSVILASIGIVFVILAGVFFIKMSLDSGWLTPMRQITLAAASGLSFFLAPQFFPKAEKEYGAYLAGAGTTILHFTWLGAYTYHHILEATSALICASLIGIFSVLTKLEKGNRLYLLVAMAGTYLSAPIVGYNTGDLTVLSVFLIIWNLSFSVAALVMRRRDLVFIASYFAIFTVLLLSGKSYGLDEQRDLLILQVIQFGIFSITLLFYSVHHKNPLSSQESVAIFPLLLLFYGSASYLVKGVIPSFYPWLGLAMGSVFLVIYFSAKKMLGKKLSSGSPLLSMATIALTHSLFFQLLPDPLMPLAAWLIGVLVMLIWSQNERARTELYFPSLILLAVFCYGALLTIVSVNTIESIFFYNWIYGFMAVAAAIYLLGSHTVKDEKPSYLPVLLGFGHFEVMLGLYRFSDRVSWSGALFVTFSWGLYAAAILTAAVIRKDKTLGSSALIILLAVSFKAFFYDLGSTSNLIRVICLLAEGLLLYCCGWIFKKMKDWKALS